MLQPNEIYLNGNNSTVQIASAHETSKTFSYNGNEVLFDIKDDVMVNATQLAKIYGKRPNDYLSLPATNQLINAITRKYGISENQLVISKAGSSHNGGGTWMHRLIVVDFCQWLDIDLKLWCTEKLDELMRYGMTATQPTLEQMINNPDLVISLATQLKSEREEKQRLALEVQKKEQEKQTIIEEAKPAVVFTECVTSSSTNILIGDLAKLITQNGYKIGEIRLYEWMVENKFLIRRQRYSRSKNKYIKKYGKPKKHYESFSNERVPIDKMRAVNSDICDYASYYFFQNGVIVVSISPFGCVKVSYEDEYNSLLGKQEEEKYRENDI